ncbi:MAG: hypothetical protein PHG67_03180 [Bacteroidales bacterium]|jgi:hypothetical protein|nr:hypothetical protein [Bacteroidales bacterium]HOI31251.1 hypothetical protein [Bacteroidales bacterium]
MFKKAACNTKYSSLVFWAILAVYLVVIEQFLTSLLHPQGIHFIRQTDSLSFASNYFRFGNGFFNPQVYNLSSVNGNAANEFPLLYFLVSFIYKLIGEQDFVLRILNLSISVAGFYALFKIIGSIVGDCFYTLFFTFTLISSTVLMYYSNNYLPDPTALSFAIIGWWFFLEGIRSKRNSVKLPLAFLFFTLSSLIKITYLINPVAAVLSCFIFVLYNRNKPNSTLNYVSVGLFFAVSLLLVAFWWFVFVKMYNSTNNDFYFLTTIRPVWNLSSTELSAVFDAVSRWHTEYFYFNSYYLFGLLLTGLLFLKRKDFVLMIVASLLLLGSVFYILLFFAQFHDHDYYFLVLFIPVVFTALLLFISLYRKFRRFFDSLYFKVFLSIFCLLALFDTTEQVKNRYDNSKDKFSEVGFILKGYDLVMDSLGISQDAKVVVYPDMTRNGSLYFIKRKGWTVGGQADDVNKKITQLIEKGADYLITLSTVNGLGLDTLYVDKKITIYKTKKPPHTEAVQLQPTD